jgi:hypothetical protein
MDNEHWHNGLRIYVPQPKSYEQMDWNSQAMVCDSMSQSHLSQNETEPSVNTSAASFGGYNLVPSNCSSLNHWDVSARLCDLASGCSSMCSSASTLMSEKSYQGTPSSYAQSFAPAPSFDFTAQLERYSKPYSGTQDSYRENEDERAHKSLSVGPGLVVNNYQPHTGSQWPYPTSLQNPAARCKSYDQIEEFSLGSGYPS